MTKIEFTDEQLHVMMTALETYSRLRAGQVSIAMNTAYRDYWLTAQESEAIEDCVRNIVFTEPFSLEHKQKAGFDAPVERPALNKNSYFGVFSQDMLKSGGTLAYEIYSTLRQYVALKNNDGYAGTGVCYDDPVHVTKVPLPVIEGFTTEKHFPIKGKAIVSKLDKAQETKNYTKVWDVVGEYLKRKYPEMSSYCSARIEKDGNHYVVFVKGSRAHSPAASSRF